jgi:hypothetical protein
MNGNLKCKLLGLSVIILLVALFFEDIRHLFELNTSNTTLTPSIEKQIIQSWKNLIHLPKQRLDSTKKFKVAIGYIFQS